MGKRGGTNLLHLRLMVNLASWNIRGLNAPLKQKEIRKFIRGNSLDIVAVLETKVRESNSGIVKDSIGGDLNWVNNYNFCHRGRIWVLWNGSSIRLRMLEQSEQFIHCEIETVASGNKFMATFVYGDNGYIERRRLWEDIIRIYNNMGNTPWVIMGDFNAIRKREEKSGSSRQ